MRILTFELRYSDNKKQDRSPCCNNSAFDLHDHHHFVGSVLHFFRASSALIKRICPTSMLEYTEDHKDDIPECCILIRT